MLSNDVPPNRLQRVKLATQDLINELQGDRVGLVAFAGRAFLQAPLTIDYDAAVEAINDLDTNTIPEGGTNISDAIDLAVHTFGKSAIGNRAVIIFTDGEELERRRGENREGGGGCRRANLHGRRRHAGGFAHSDQHGEGGGTAFVKDSKGQVVKSKLDEKRLREIAESTGGFYLHLEDGPRTMKQLFAEGLAKMQAGDIDARLSRRPIERYQWPLGARVLALACVVPDARAKTRAGAPRSATARKPKIAAGGGRASAACCANCCLSAAAPGLEAYRQRQISRATRNLKDVERTSANARRGQNPVRCRRRRLQNEGLRQGAEFVQPGVALAGCRLAKQESLQSWQHPLPARRDAKEG